MATSTRSTTSRRRLLQGAIAAIAAVAAGQFGLWLPRLARAAWPAEAFAAKTPDDALRTLFGDQTIIPTDRIHVDMPVLAEDGSVVPLSISADLDGVESICVIAGKNPVPLIARFDFGHDAVLPEIATRIKLAKTSTVTVVAKAGDRLYSTGREVKVIKGGCD